MGGRIIVEFGTPNAKSKAKEWKKELVEDISKAIANLKKEGAGPIFKDSEFSVYYTFDEYS